MHSISLPLALQLARLVGLYVALSVSTAIISPASVSVHVSHDTTASSTSTDDSTNNSSDLVLNQSLNFTSLTSPDVAQIQPSFCPYDSIHQPQPLLSYDLSTAPLASDCVHILDMINDTQRRGYWTLDLSDLEQGITLIEYKSCAFEMRKDMDGNHKITKQFKWGVEELKFYLGTWLQKQRHGRLGAVGEVDCWVEGEQKKEEGGVRVKWIVRSAAAAV